MAKRLILGVLVKVLGEFIELDENNFSLAVWSGTVVLTNLRLKADNILQKFNFVIHHGYVERLEIVIPWASLLSNPLKIKLEGVVLDVGPVDLDGLAREEILKMMVQEKLQKLKLIDQFLEISSSVMMSSESHVEKTSNSATSESYLQSWTSKIIDNIELSFSKIHLRYEDGITIVGKTVAAGITLDSFVLGTCDENWQAGFQAKSNSVKDTVFKLATIDGLGMYWEMDTTPIASFPFEEWKIAMQRLIYTRTNRDTHLHYILSPKGSLLKMKLAHYKKAAAGEVRFAAWLESKDLRLTLDNQQYKQIFTLYSNLAALKEVKDPNNYRPLVRPLDGKFAVRQWWRYAMKLAILRPHYLRILRLTKRAAAEKLMPEAFISPEDMDKFRTMEERLPLKVLEAFRKRAVAEYIEEQKIERSKESRKDTSGQWWGWLGPNNTANGSVYDLSKESDISLEDIVSEFDKLESSNARLAFQAFSFTLAASCSIVLSSNARNLVKIQAALSTTFEKKFDTIQARCDLQDLMITDELGVCPFHDKLISMKVSDDQNSNAYAATDVGIDGNTTLGTSVIIAVIRGKANIQIYSLPLEVYLNKVLIHLLMLEFALPKQHKARRMKRKMHHIRLESHLGGNSEASADSGFAAAKSLSQAVMKGHADISVSIKVHGPKIIIPEDCTRDLGCLLLDCGFIELTAAVNSSGMSCDLKINSVNAGLPLTLSDVYLLKGSSLYLIKPFDLALLAQNIDQSEADMTVSLVLSPGVNGELDTKKLARLLRITNGMTDIVSPKASPFSESSSQTKSDSTVISRQTSGSSLSNLAEASSPVSRPVNSTPLQHQTGTENAVEPTGQMNGRLPAVFPLLLSPQADGKDPNNVDMKITVQIVSVSLDLMYSTTTTTNNDPAEPSAQEHIVFMIKGLDLSMVNRPADRQIDFIMSDLSIQDSWRVEEQRYVAWTPQTENNVNLITVSYLSCNNATSPLYTTHGSLLKVDFSDLCLSVDTATLLHLKPFCEVLLDKSNRITTIQTLAESDDQDASVNSGKGSGLGGGKLRMVSFIPTNNDAPIGMKVEASMGLISINLLRAPTGTTQGKMALEPAFSVSMQQMRVTVDMKELMNSTLQLKKVEILDNRQISKDYVFKHLFCPTSTADASSDDQKVPDGDLLTLFYTQESKSQTFITVNIAGISSYVAVDAMLDFAMIAMANFFAFTNLLASPAPPVASATGTLSREPVVATTAATEMSTYTMNAAVKMIDSKLILLEDPAISDSRAIVGQCATELHFSREVRTQGSRIEMFESLHISVSDNEMYVLRSIHQWHSPIPILEPFGVELHVKRNMINGQVALTSMQLEIDDIDAKLSFNDLLLGLSIFSRRSLAQSHANDTTTGDVKSTSTPTPNQPTKDLQSSYRELDTQQPIANPVVPSVMVQIGLTSMNVTVVNDFNHLPIPVIKVIAEDINVIAQGLARDIKGEGAAHIKMEYFNSPKLAWEPVLDNWKPSFHVISDAVSHIFEVRSDNTLQLTISGSMLETMLRSYSVFFHENRFHLEERNMNTAVSSITVQNILGEGISLTLVDSVSQTTVLQLADGESGAVSSFADPSKKSWMKMFRMPNAVDLQLVGPEMDRRQPIMHLPFTLNKAKACMLLPAVQSQDTVSAVSTVDTATVGNDSSPQQQQQQLQQVFIVEAIEEEVYENARYDPLAGKWRSPYLLGDPYPWTDASSLVRKDLDSIEIHSDKWEWSGQWEIDMDGVVGRDFDENGWEYANSFSFFTMVSARRGFQAMDGVRRRRWTRTRVPKVKAAQSHRNVFRPFTLFWDVQTLTDGSRFVQVRSSFQIINAMPCDMYVDLQHSSWTEHFKVGPIKEGESFSVPLLQSYASQLRYRAGSPTSRPSAFFPCNIHSYDFKSSKDIQCTVGDRTCFFRMWTIREDKALTVKLLPYVQISNRLLCDVQFSCMDRSLEVVESGDISSGDNVKLLHVNLKDDVRVSIRFGAFNWSYPILLNKSKPTEGIVEMDRSGDRRDILPLCYCSRLDEEYGISLDLFFKVAMIDHSGLDLLVRTAHGKKNQYLTRGFRNSGGEPTASTTTAAAISPRSQSSSDKQLQQQQQLSLKRKKSASAMSPSMSLPAIDDIEVLSNVSPLLVKIDVGSAAYTDSNFKWTHLPRVFRNKFSIRFANSDKNFRSSQFFSFTARAEMLLFVLVDATFVPKWLLNDGFQPTSEVAVSRRIYQGRLLEVNYRIYGKVVGSSTTPAGEKVTLGGAWGNEAPHMYSLVLISHSQWQMEQADAVEGDQAHQQLTAQISHASDFTLELAGLSWTEGCNGVTAFYSKDNFIQIRTGIEDSWSDEISIDTRKNSATKGSIEIISERSSIIYHVSYSLQNLPGLYHQTQLITFMPRFCVLNCLEEAIFIAQRGSNRHLAFKPYTPEGWHQIDDKFGFDVLFRSQSSIWSLGSVNINEIGTSVLYIPCVNPTEVASSAASATSTTTGNSRGVVLHVEVKLAGHTDHCSIIVIVWQETIESQSTMSVQNDTELPITIRQADLELDHDLGNQEHLYELVVPPGKHLPYGLCDPDCGPNVLVTVGTSLQHSSKRVATLNILKVGHRLRLPFSTSSSGVTKGEVILNVTTSDVGHVLRISPATSVALDLLQSDDEEAIQRPTTASTSTSTSTSNTASSTTTMILGFNLVLSSFGVSLVLEKPQRREFFSLYLDGVEMQIKTRGPVTTMEFAVMDLQVDNYSESAIYPIILRSTKKEVHKSVVMDGEEEILIAAAAAEADEGEGEGVIRRTGGKRRTSSTAAAASMIAETPLIKLLIVKDVNTESKQAVFQRVVLRVLPLALEVDSATMQILFLDLLDDLKILSSDQAFAASMPVKWFQHFNQKLFYPNQQVIDVVQVKVTAQRYKMYIKKLTIHPMKITISLYQTALPRRVHRETLQSALLNFFLQLAGVEKMQIRLSSFDVEDAMESLDTLVSLIVTKSGQDLRSQLASIAGSLAVLGSPIGFARKVGSGVKAFFYEPYLGVVEGSNDFLSGLKKGTGRLLSGVVTGTMDSAAAMIGSASKGMAYLTGDEDYVRKRAIKRQQIRQGQKGIYAGFREGGESFMSGIASGVSGMIAKPIEEAAKGGVQGFIKGVGLGFLGMAIKPLVGLTDGVTSIAYGISTEVDPNNIFVHVRPPRALEPSPLDPSVWIIVPLNLDAAFAQEFVMKRAVQNKYDDRFLSYVPIAHKEEAVILSDVYIFWRRKKSLWGRVWANVSHCIPLGNALGIMLYSGALQGKAELVIIPCGTTQVLRRLYTAVAQNVHRMGNPAKVVSPDLVDWATQSTLLQRTHSHHSTASSGNSSREHSLVTLNHTTTSSASSAAVSNVAAEETTLLQSEHYRRLLQDASLLGELDGHRFGSVNGKMLKQIAGSEVDVILRSQHAVQRGSRTWKELDEILWRLLWEWGCVHANLASCRCCAALLINRSDSPIQVTRVQMAMGRNVTIMGSTSTGYEAESRILWPRGYVVVFLVAFPQSPLEVGHLKATVHSAAFTLVLASTQRESFCEAKGGFTAGFLEKTVSEWWSKYVLLVS